jgi:hypothetical protein
MRRRKHARSLATLISTLALAPVLALACSSSSSSGGVGADSGATPDATNGADSGNGTDSGSGTDSGMGTDSAAISDAGGDSAAAECAAQTTNMACQSCCDTNYAAGFNVYVAALLPCACGDAGGCGTACAATACAGGMPDLACNTCLNTVQTQADGAPGACTQATSAACSPSPDCMAWYACSGPCVTKP